MEDYFTFDRGSSPYINQAVGIGIVQLFMGIGNSQAEWDSTSWDYNVPVGFSRAYSRWPMNSSTVSTWWSPQNDSEHYSHFDQSNGGSWMGDCSYIPMSTGYSGARWSYWTGARTGGLVKVAGDNALGWEDDSCNAGRAAIYVVPCEWRKAHVIHAMRSARAQPAGSTAAATP